MPSSVHTTVLRIDNEEQMEFIHVQLGISQWYDSYPPTHTQKCYLFVYLYFSHTLSLIHMHCTFWIMKLSIKWLFFVLEVVLINSRYFASTACWVQMTALWSLEGSCLWFDTACQLYAVSNTANWQFYSNSHSHSDHGLRFHWGDFTAIHKLRDIGLCWQIKRYQTTADVLWNQWSITTELKTVWTDGSVLVLSRFE